MLAVVLSSVLALTAQSPSAMAAVAVFAVNADRQWPSDEREPVVTAEALRLMEAAALEVAAGAKPENKAATVSIDRFKTARTAAGAAAQDATMLKAALVAGAEAMADLVATSKDATTTQRVAELKRLANAFDKKIAPRQQAGAIEKYFKSAAALLRGVIQSTT